MAKTKYMKKNKNGKEYYFYRLYDKRLKDPKDLCAKSVKELDEKIKKIKFELDNKIITDNSKFLDFFEYWLFEIHFINKKASTKEKYEGIYRNYINVSYFKKIKLKSIDLILIQDYYNQLIKKDTSNSTIKSIHKLMVPAIKYAFAQNKIIKDFSVSLILPQNTKSTKKSVEPFTYNEQIEFLKAIQGHRLEILFITALNTGLRQGELFALTWDDIDLDNKILSVNKSIKEVTNVSKEGRGKTELLLQTTKTLKSNRYVPLPEFLVKKLLIYKEKQQSEIKSLSNLYIDNNLIFTNTLGGYLSPSNVRKSFKKILKEYNIKNIKFHDLRHTYATRLFEAGEEPKIIQELLGHANISITLDTYTHILDKLKFKSTSKLDELFSSLDF